MRPWASLTCRIRVRLVRTRELSRSSSETSARVRSRSPAFSTASAARSASAASSPISSGVQVLGAQGRLGGLVEGRRVDAGVEGTGGGEALVGEVVGGPDGLSVELDGAAESVSLGDPEPGGEAGAFDASAAGALGGVDVGGAVRAAEGHVRQVEAEEPAGAAGDHPQQAVEVVGEGEVAGGVGEGGEPGLAAGVPLASGPDLGGQGDGPFEAVEFGGVGAGGAGLVDEPFEAGGGRLPGEEFEDREQRVGTTGSVRAVQGHGPYPRGRAKSGTWEETRTARRK